MPVHTCSECGHSFTRRHNMLRHQQEFHPELKDSDTESDDEADDIADEEDPEDELEEDSGNEENRDEESDNEEEEIPQKYNLWVHLKQKALGNKAVQKKYEEALETLSDESTNQNAMRVVLPDIRKLVYQYYEQLLLLWHYAEEDSSHNSIMETKRKLVDEEDYDDEEAIRYAVKKRRFLIQKETDTLDEDYETQNSGSDADSVDEPESIDT